MKKGLIYFLISVHCVVTAQPYVGKNGKTRHRFAQTVIGLDLQMSSGGNSVFINKNNLAESFKFGYAVSPAIYISGTHFWGHAEFYFSFPVVMLNHLRHDGLNYAFSQSDIFGTKIYPWAICKNKLRPYIGFGISGMSYHQYTNTSEGNGPQLSLLKMPLMAGLNYCTGNYLLDAGVNYNYASTASYYISQATAVNIHSPAFILHIGLRKWLETTTSGEKSYLDGSTQKQFERLSQQKKLSSWFVGAGVSSAFYTSHFSFNSGSFAYMDKPFASVFPEISAGYYYQPFGLHAAITGLTNRTTIKAYGTTQTFKRAALILESYKYIFDYNGFDPYAGICLSYEWLYFSQSAAALNISAGRQKVSPGFTFGWDILPDKLQGMTLRTSLRYFLCLTIEPQQGRKVKFDQFEFNFIQFILYPQRIRNISRQD